MKIALTIAGSDPSGGAGIQADLKTFCRFGVYGEAVVTLATVQNTVTVKAVHTLPPELVAAQIRAVVEDMAPGAAKTGALGEAAVVRVVAREARGFRFPLVVDPVMISKHGAPLMVEEARLALIGELLPLCRVVTPNLHEAGALAGMEVLDEAGMLEAARRIRERCGAAVLVKGGHLTGEAVDLLVDGDSVERFVGARYETAHTHGTGCTYSAAIAAGLALGLGLKDAVGRGKRFIGEAIRTNPGLGHGNGPVNHFADCG